MKEKYTRTIEDQLRDIVAHERLHNNRNERGSTLRRVAAGIILCAGIAAIYTGAKSLEGETPEETAQKLENKVVNKIKQNELSISKDVIVLGQGAKVRETPARYVYNPESGKKDRNVNNIAFEVGENQNVIITNAVAYKDSDNETWMGFFVKNQGEKSPKLRWINKDALLNDAILDNGESEEDSVPPISIVVNPNQETMPVDYLVVTNKSDEIIGLSDPSGITNLATASIVDSAQTSSILGQFGIKQ